MTLILFSLWPLWPFNTDYFVQHWATLGDGHFIALATGVNIALLGWEAFRERVSAERRLDEKVYSVFASVADLLDTNHYQYLVHKVLRPIKKIRLWAWRFVRIIAVLAVPFGVAILYCGTCTPYDMFLLLPTTVQIAVSWTTLAFIMGWMWLMRKGMMIFGSNVHFPSRQSASEEVTDAISKARKTFDSPP